MFILNINSSEMNVHDRRIIITAEFNVAEWTARM